MFQLDQALELWRHRMDEGGLHSADVLEELESHLRDDVDAQVSAGASAEEAFATSTARLGGADLLKPEFDKLGGPARRRVRSAWLTLAGIPLSHPSNTLNSMNPSTTLEPRWVTYTKAAIFASPALLLTIFAAMFLMPKLQRICQEAGMKLPGVYHAAASITEHPVMVALLLIVPFAMLEWRWSRWPQFRRISLGGTVFVINAAVMVLLAAMLVLALVAAPGLTQR